MTKLKDKYDIVEKMKLMSAFNDILNTEKGFMIVYSGEGHKIIDVYHNINREEAEKYTKLSLEDKFKGSRLDN